MATAAALIAAKKAKDKEAAMAREKQEKEVTTVRAENEIQQSRQVQQREMTPDNLKIVEQKLLEFQKQQQEVRQKQSFRCFAKYLLNHKVTCDDLTLLLVRMSVLSEKASEQCQDG